MIKDFKYLLQFIRYLLFLKIFSFELIGKLVNHQKEKELKQLKQLNQQDLKTTKVQF